MHAATLGAVFPVDDAYITLHNAMALRGLDESYAGVPPLVGATSSVHVALVAGLLPMAKPAVALLAAAWIAIVLYVFGLLRLAFAKGASVLQAATLTIVGVTAGDLVYQLLNGLETGLALATVVWSLALMDVGSRAGRILRGILCGTMPFIRPELGALVLLFVALEIVPHGRAGAEVTTKDRVTFLVAALVAALPWLLLNARATGMPFPSTIGAKKVFFAEGCRPPAQKLRLVLERIMIFHREVGAIAWAWALLVGLRRGWIGLAFATVMYGAYFLAFPQALDHYNYRYVYILLPFAFFACAASFRAASARRRAAATALVVIGLADAFVGLDDHVDKYLRSRRFTLDALEETAAWSRDNLPKDARVLVHDAGYFAYATPFQLFDVVGLKTPSSIREHTEITWASCGERRDEAVHRIALRLAPDHLVALRSWPFHIADALRRHGWRLEEIHHSPINGYDVFRLQPP
ncbi:MAG TPA: hypothetical protein VM925_35310 [Labilithrix sp.]|nr:hypothetical protein [Labilithrix sp.]